MKMQLKIEISKVGAIGLIFSEKSFAGQCETVINCMENVEKPQQLILRRNWTRGIDLIQPEHAKQNSKKSNNNAI